jgi:hypothetical protein
MGAMIELSISAPSWIWFVLGFALVVHVLLGVVSLYVSLLTLRLERKK